MLAARPWVTTPRLPLWLQSALQPPGCVPAARPALCCHLPHPLPLGRSHLLGRLPEHVTHAAPTPQPVAQHGDNAHQQRLARVLFVLLYLLSREQLYKHSKR